MNINHSLFYCRFKHINKLFTETLELRFYKLTPQQINNISLLFRKLIPNTLDLTNYLHIWYLLGPSCRLPLYEFNELKNTIYDLKIKLQLLITDYQTLQINYLIDDYLKGLVAFSDDVAEVKLPEVQNFLYNFMQHHETVYLITDKIFYLINQYKSNPKLNNFILRSTLNIVPLSSNSQIDWLLRLIKIYKDTKGAFPTNCLSIFTHFRRIYSSMLDCEAKELIDIIDSRLGGCSLKNIKDISENLCRWLRLNTDCLPEDIKKNIIL